MVRSRALRTWATTGSEETYALFKTTQARTDGRTLEPVDDRGHATLR